jgi:SpoVK/Ycf46/Vps4 family AAA+-type ATPase
VTSREYVPPRFEDEIAAHLVLNHVDLPAARPPLILGIHGPKGEGKTWQAEVVFREMGVHTYRLSGEEFGSVGEGEPVEKIRMHYKQAAHHNMALRRHRGRDPDVNLAVLFINDIDARIGRQDGLIQHTINTQLINATLMELADAPDQFDGTRVPRVPIVATANNLNVLYAPLRREGRMHLLEWIPTSQEKVAIAERLVPDCGITAEDIESLIDGRSRRQRTAKRSTSSRGAVTVAALAAAKYELYRRRAVDLVHEWGLTDILGAIRAGDLEGDDFTPEITRDAYLDALRASLARLAVTDHLAGT